MRTKTLLLTAALGVASVATSMAQAVYSVNIVGYVSQSLRPGFNLIANQLNGSPNNNLNTVLPGVPLESQVLKFANNNYNSDIYDGSAWLDATTGNPSTTVANPGQGFFFFNPGAANISATFVGEVVTGNGLTVPLPAGFSLISSIVPQDISLTAANGFPQILEAQYLTFNAATQNYDTPLINDGTGWLDSVSGNPADARPVVGQGFFYFNPNASAAAWTRNFNPNTP